MLILYVSFLFNAGTCNDLYPVISFQRQPTNTIIKSNDTAVFDCQIKGAIAAQITWLKDGAIIRMNTWRFDFVDGLD